MTRQRLDNYLVDRRLAASRHQAADFVNRRLVKVDGRLGRKPGQLVEPATVRVRLLKDSAYVSRGGDKLAGAAGAWKLNFDDATVADLGCGVGGFSDYALQAGAARVLAVDVGREPLAGRLQSNSQLVWQPGTDVRRLVWPDDWPEPDWILIDLAFISLRRVLPRLASLAGANTGWIVLAKPQFEAAGWQLHHGVVKNSRRRREILAGLEGWLAEEGWRLLAKRNSSLAGAKGNLERFYHLRAPNRGG